VSTPKFNSKKLAAALAPVALAGAMMAPTAAASTPPSAHSPAATAQTKVGFSKGFPIYNHSSRQIRLINITGDGNFEGRPADGTVLKPGDSTRVEVQFRAFTTQEDHANFQILGEDGNSIGTFTAHMGVNPLSVPFAYCETTVGSCTPAANNEPSDPDNGPWNFGKTTIELQ
jgi:hypothetical protein